MTSPRTSHTATLLQNGKVLITGGQLNNDGDGLDTAELFDPLTESFTAIPNKMISPRGGHAAVLLNEGYVLLMGGFYNSSVALRTAEVYDPATDQFYPLPTLLTSPRAELTASLLPDGKVLIAGGESDQIFTDTAELFDPSTLGFTAISATMTSIRGAHSATQLSNGDILMTGGITAFSIPILANDTAEVFDPLTQSFTAIDSRMTSPRAMHASSLLDDGSALITGGMESFDGTTIDFADTVELFVP
jgi:hypothetical protein